MAEQRKASHFSDSTPVPQMFYHVNTKNNYISKDASYQKSYNTIFEM